MGPTERALGRVEGVLEGLTAQLTAHTAQDNANFEALAAKLDALDLSAQARKVAWKTAAWVAGGVLTLAQIAQAFGWLPVG